MKLLRRLLFHNFGLKLISIGVAVLLWTAVANEPPVEVVFQSPLEFREMPQALELSSEVPTSVQLRVSGPGSVVRQLSAKDLAVTVNLAGFERAGERSFALTDADVRKPYGVRVVQIVPSQVRVRFEAQAQRDIPIIPRIAGQFAPRYQLAAYKVFPQTARVVGPQSRVAVLESATTDPVDVSGVISRAQIWVHAVVPDPLVRIQGRELVLVTIHMERRR